MRKPDKKISNISDLLKYLKQDTEAYKDPLWFRGQSDEKWRLLPTFARPGKNLSESNLIKKFKQNATLLLNPRPDDEFEWLFLMQHYGIKTRLLDWTESPLTALYFATKKKKPAKDGVLWILLPVELNKHSNIKPDFPHDIPSFEEDALNNYKPESFASETTSKLYPLAALAPRNNSRMQAQLSVFTISHRDETPLEEINDRKHIWRYIIPKENKEAIRKELKILGIGEFQLFPELPSIAEILHGE